MNNLTVMTYWGHVDVSLKINDKVVKLEAHNSGLPGLQKVFCKFLTGNYEGEADTPQYLDLRSNSAEPEVETMYSWKDWDECLNERVSLSERTYFSEEEGAVWAARFSGTITYDMLRSSVDTGKKYRFYLYTKKDYTEEYTYLAYLNIDPKTLAMIQPGTMAVIEWKMQIDNGGSN